MASEPVGIAQNKKRKSLKIKDLRFWVPGAGVEPAHPFGHWCLRPTRLPIPPSGLDLARAKR